MRTRSALADHPRPRSKESSAPARCRRYGRSVDMLRELAAGKPLQDTPPDAPALQRRLAQLEQQIAKGREQFARQLGIDAGDVMQSFKLRSRFSFSVLIRRQKNRIAGQQEAPLSGFSID